MVVVEAVTVAAAVTVGVPKEEVSVDVDTKAADAIGPRTIFETEDSMIEWEKRC